MIKLKLKREYLNHSVGGGKFKKRKFCDVHESEFQKYFNAGFTEFFEVVEEKPLKKEKPVLKEEIKENNIENDSNK